MKKEKKQWEVPEIITYSEDEILKAIKFHKDAIVALENLLK